MSTPSPFGIQSGTSFRFLRQMINGEHDLENDTLFFAMYSTLAFIEPQTVDDQASITGELVGNGYTAGGEQLTQSVIYTPGGEDRPAIDFVDLTFGPGATWGIGPSNPDAAQGAVIYTLQQDHSRTRSSGSSISDRPSLSTTGLLSCAGRIRLIRRWQS